MSEDVLFLAPVHAACGPLKPVVSMAKGEQRDASPRVANRASRILRAAA